ncbi:MAG: SUMF1/EgtB/PvdO family nonheme iron enzyme [Anaerolineales bacterium]|nr:SUMF1/EgtB/PvdO family nonheme iron enzyme [Anaerolineales bacterium]
MARIEKTIFISYRRKDVAWALAVYQDLTHRGYDVFFDFTNIPSGDFEQNILSNIKARAHFVLILTPTALDRCSEPGDWLRREIELAIDEKRNIIPLFFDGFNFGNVSEKLTGKLQKVSLYNGMNVHQDYFLEAMERLRNKFLNVPLNAILHPVSTEVREVVLEEQRAANKAAKEARREEIRKRRKEVVRKIISLISSNSRWIGIGGTALIFLLFAAFGGNYLLNNLSVTTPTPGIGSTMISDKDGMTLAYVPAGEFVMGSNLTFGPEHKIYLDAFWVDQTEVTNKMYAQCVAKNKCDPPTKVESYTHSDYYGNTKFNEYPVLYVNWNMANGYCEWAGRRLPTEAEWEKSARGTNTNTYPWGEESPNANLLNFNNNLRDTTEIGTYPNGASIYGALDMAGNVWEWVNDWYSETYYQDSPLSNPLGPDSGTYRVLRGGSWSNRVDDVRTTSRIKYDPMDTSNGIGFRCASSP